MPVKRTQYSAEFKLQAVKRILEDGHPQTQVAADLGISANTLSSWKNAYLKDAEAAFPGHGRQTPEQAELTRLRREVARLKRENQGDWLGCMRGTMEIVGDIISPACDPDEWEALRD